MGRAGEDMEEGKRDAVGERDPGQEEGPDEGDDLPFSVRIREVCARPKRPGRIRSSRRFFLCFFLHLFFLLGASVVGRSCVGLAA